MQKRKRNARDVKYMITTKNVDYDLVLNIEIAR